MVYDVSLMTKSATVGKLLWFKENKTFWDMRLLETNQHSKNTKWS